MPHVITLEPATSACRDACILYAAELRRAGLGIVVEEAELDFVFEGGSSSCIRIQWTCLGGRPSEDAAPADLGESDEPPDEQTLSVRAVEQYEQTLMVLSRNHSAAAELLARTKQKQKTE